MQSLRETFRRHLDECAYPGYVYGYPHKKTYRPLNPAWSRADAWADDDSRHLYAYVHLPFCNQRCSFCNLFTYVPGREDPVSRYLDALARDMDAMARSLRVFSFARLYLGGGTPTYLDATQLRRLFHNLRECLGIDPACTQGCIETSPETIDPERLAVLKDAGIQRVSLGVQSFVPEELRQINRRFEFAAHERAVRQIDDAGFPEFNIDLIYGLPGQTRETWFRSLDAALATSATSLFLYPLYIRPLTGLDRRADLPPTPSPVEMHEWYDETVERLASVGFRQSSLRHFHRGPEPIEDEYRCQHDGMVGLGAGARSYTRRLHYSTPWRMTTRNIRGVIDDYCTAMESGDFAIRHGFVLDDDERTRRRVIQTLFAGGWTEPVPAPLAEVFATLEGEGCVEQGKLTRLGVRHSDLVAGLFFSPAVRERMEGYEYDA